MSIHRTYEIIFRDRRSSRALGHLSPARGDVFGFLFTAGRSPRFLRDFVAFKKRRERISTDRFRNHISPPPSNPYTRHRTFSRRSLSIVSTRIRFLRRPYVTRLRGRRSTVITGAYGSSVERDCSAYSYRIQLTLKAIAGVIHIKKKATGTAAKRRSPVTDGSLTVWIPPCRTHRAIVENRARLDVYTRSSCPHVLESRHRVIIIP